ncbi:MAG TPA: family 20 glycosylhydrolase [bacterium]|nr:family 20 glycosylhydrolase [bacterium]
MKFAPLCCSFLLALTASAAAAVSLVPQPVLMKTGKGSFAFSASTPIVYPAGSPEAGRIARLLGAEINQSSGLDLAILPSSQAGRSAPIRLLLDPALKEAGLEGYRLTISRRELLLAAPSPAGLYRGGQTLRQMLPSGSGKRTLALPALEIIDQPRFSWRGVHVDVGRHFHSVSYMKRIIDWMALYKMNRLHWHLTEDQGWRIEIKKYPLLTGIGAWRTEPDGSRYGGFYTQQEIREVVGYAADRFIDVVPEIEMPGHCMAALAAYPGLSCAGGPFAVQTQWGVFKEVYCAGREETFAFLEDVLSEVIELFPFGYLHIGGDEVPRDRWQACPRCQARIKAEGLDDEAELQSWFISRIEKYLSAHGRRLIGWDEILDGGLAPGATVQSWRGMEGALIAARSGHDAIVSPGSHTYFNADISAIDLRKAYSFEPVPAGLEPERIPYIIGGECCLWSERITEENLDYQLFPRLLALSEVLWSHPGQRDYADFLRRVRNHYPLLETLGIGFGPEARPVSLLTRFHPDEKFHTVTLESGEEGMALHYTLDGAEPTTASPRYTSQLTIDRPTRLRARAFRDGRGYGESAGADFDFHLAFAAPLQIDHSFSPNYPAGGGRALVDGLRGSIAYGDGRWQGYEEVDLIATIDLGEIRPLHRLRAGFLQDTGSWIFLPAYVEWSVSRDGSSFRTVAAFDHPTPAGTSEQRIQEDQTELPGTMARFVRLRARNVGLCPAWHPGAGGKSWIFVDELVVQ